MSTHHAPGLVYDEGSIISWREPQSMLGQTDGYQSCCNCLGLLCWWCVFTQTVLLKRLGWLGDSCSYLFPNLSSHSHPAPPFLDQDLQQLLPQERHVKDPPPQPPCHYYFDVYYHCYYHCCYYYSAKTLPQIFTQTCWAHSNADADLTTMPCADEEKVGIFQRSIDMVRR